MFVLTGNNVPIGGGTNTETITVDTGLMGYEKADTRGGTNIREHQILDRSYRFQVIGRKSSRVRINGAYAINVGYAALHTADAEWIKAKRLIGRLVDINFGTEVFGTGLVVDVPTTYDVRLGATMARRVWSIDVLMQDRGDQAHILGYTGTPVGNPFAGMPTEPTTPEPPVVTVPAGFYITSSEEFSGAASLAPGAWAGRTLLAAMATPADEVATFGPTHYLVGRLPILTENPYIAIAIPSSYEKGGASDSITIGDNNTPEPADAKVGGLFSGSSSVTLATTLYRIEFTPNQVSFADFTGKYIIVGVTSDG